MVDQRQQTAIESTIKKRRVRKPSRAHITKQGQLILKKLGNQALGELEDGELPMNESEMEAARLFLPYAVPKLMVQKIVGSGSDGAIKISINNFEFPDEEE